MNDVTIWAEMLAVPVAIGFLAAMICLFKDRLEFERHHPHKP